MKHFSALALFASSVAAVAQTEAPRGCTTVGHGNNFDAIKKALAGKDECLFIEKGIYKGQLIINRAVTIYGYTKDTSSFAKNEVTITDGIYAGGKLADPQTSTILVDANNVKLYNLNIVNSAGKRDDGGQAVALGVQGDSGFYGCTISGYQDTLMAQSGKQLYVGCRIEGAVDIIFGQSAFAVITRSEIAITGGNDGGVITANGARRQGASIYMLDRITVTKTEGHVPAGSVYLGRPWSEYAAVHVQYSVLPEIISLDGFRPWGETPKDRHGKENDHGHHEHHGHHGDHKHHHEGDNSDKPAKQRHVGGKERRDAAGKGQSNDEVIPKTVAYSEYKNSGPGAADGHRPSPIVVATKPYSFAQVLGDKYESQRWADMKWLKDTKS